MSPVHEQKRSFNFYWLIFLVFIVLILFFVKGLRLNPNFLPSQLIEKPFPEFTLRTIGENSTLKHRKDIVGEPALVHVWATWCGVCLQEHEELLNIQKIWPYKMVGVNYKDEPTQVIKWLSKKGSPYDFSLDDRTGKLGLDLGVYGTPETYILDASGTIIARQVGPITVENIQKVYLPLLAKKDQLAK